MTSDTGLACSDASLARADPMYGTASAGKRWLLLELSGGWGPSALLQSPSVIDPGLGRSIVRRVEAAGMRIAAIRRHGRRDAERRWRWYIAEAEAGAERLYAGEVAGPADYLELALDGSDGAVTTEPVVAICAHGKHDRCCAVRGRGATAAIAAAYPEITWECSHLGGDRFAATMLILPHGLCYGRVDSTDAAGLVRLYLDGRLDNDFLRGRTSLPHAVQAAQHFARQAYGDDRIAALPPLAVDQDEDGVRVLLDAAPGPIEVVLDVGQSEPLLSQCHAKVPGRVRIFTLRALRIGESPEHDAH
ncbi:sucrase ferredoxin [Mycobacterium sp. 852013-51886_SCH5428379]|uniref:sucrase ferredoxin n=1 Tax=Mycobacterium sp. 852013-51886_SCH5428379 TaxID=1834111 RepID=UPI000801EC72|nr:sucrase ferredoxin [Mycobacterium sp. 852013-51886_SCH5428379]OBB62131.1 sucrase ferredoxin [Mycobacterium sp. 852013-51886_SCH5428379]